MDFEGFLSVNQSYSVHLETLFSVKALQMLATILYTGVEV